MHLVGRGPAPPRVQARGQMMIPMQKNYRLLVQNLQGRLITVVKIPNERGIAHQKKSVNKFKNFAQTKQQDPQISVVRYEG